MFLQCTYSVFLLMLSSWKHVSGRCVLMSLGDWPVVTSRDELEPAYQRHVSALPSSHIVQHVSNHANT